jgi:FMN phosphatase YigB (HAD superfamily)
MKSLLLDVDGVLVRDKDLMNRVQSNCVRYVRSKLPECKDPAETNRTLYLAHGHTARGLNKMYGIDTSDFNKQVYDSDLLKQLAYFVSTDAFQDEVSHVQQLKNDGWKIKLFTNAPWIWASKVANVLGPDVNIRCPGNPNDSPLKPEPEAYLFSSEDVHVFVDDSLKNLGAVRNSKHWKPVYFSPEHKEPNLWCPQVQSLGELVHYLKSFSSE